MHMPEVIDIYHGSPKVIELPVFGAGMGIHSGEL